MVFFPWTNNFIHVCLSICENWKGLTHSPHFSPTRMSQELISCSSYWEVARKKSQGSCLAFWSKANGSLCSLGWLRLRINKSTFQEFFLEGSSEFKWPSASAFLALPWSELGGRYTIWVEIGLSNEGKSKEQSTAAGLSLRLLTDRMWPGDRQTCTCSCSCSLL